MSIEANSPVIELGKVRIDDPKGLHTRPAGAIAYIAVYVHRYGRKLQVTCNGSEPKNAESTMSMMLLNASDKSELSFSVAVDPELNPKHSLTERVIENILERCRMAVQGEYDSILGVKYSHWLEDDTR